MLAYRVFVLCYALWISVCSSSTLPSNLIVGYAGWGECDEKIVKAAQDGVNVVIWFAINLLADEETGAPVITGGPDLSCVADVKRRIASLDLPTTHLISIGGWDAPHPNTSNTPEAIYENWVEWNNGLFDGFDWDIEGDDDLSSPSNVITLDCLNLMGRMSQLGKKDGYIVSMAPPESYLDPTTGHFDRLLTHNYPEWEELEPNFHYHSRNSYAYVLHYYGSTPSADGELQTFDFVSIQLYETYAHALYNISILHSPAVEYLTKYIPSVISGWEVNFMPIASPAIVTVPPPQLVIGLANGWANTSKTVLIWPEEAGKAYNLLGKLGFQPRGFMFWDIMDEGKVVSGTERELWMAAGLNEFLHTRPPAGETESR